MERKYNLRCLLVAIFLLCAVICSVGVILQNNLQDGRIPLMSRPAFEEGWTYSVGDEQDAAASFPFENKEDADHLTLSAKLPSLDGNEYLSFSNQYCGCTVFVGGKKIFDYSVEQNAPFGKMLGNVACSVPLAREYSGKTLSIRMERTYDFMAFSLQEMLLGTGGEIRFYYAKANTGVLACALMLFILAVLMLTLHFIQKSKGFKNNYRLFLQMGIFSFLTAAWVWTDSLVPQLIIGDTIFLTVISFWSFMAMPMPVICIVNDFCSHGKKGLCIAEKAIFINMIVQTLLYILDIADFPQLLVFTHGILAFTLLCMIYALVKESKSGESRFANGILFALFILILFAVAALINFYVEGSGNNNSQYYRLGLLIFVTLLTVVNIKKMATFIDEWEENRVLGKLAFTDIMTQTQNRSAYELYMEEMESCDAKERHLSMALMDLNDLKRVNDTYGHSAGDKVLVEAARCIKTAFGDDGVVYRIGGDEFVVIAEGKKTDERNYRTKLCLEIQKYNRSGENPFTMAYGFASAVKDDCRSLKELQKKADEEMYVDKQKYKA